MSISKHSVLFNLLIVVLVFSACHKKDQTSQEFNVNWGIIYLEGINDYAPCFNPNNSDEFVFIRNDFDQHTFKLIRHKISNNSNTVILSYHGELSGPNQMEWSKNGWILISTFDLPLKKLKDNGDSVTFINDSCFGASYPCFTKNNNIFYTALYPSKIGMKGNKIINMKGDLMDSLNNAEIGGLLEYSDVNSEDIAVGVMRNLSMKNIMTYDLNKKFNKTIKVLTNQTSAISGLAWHPNNQDIYCAIPPGIVKINTNTLIEEVITTGGFGLLSVSPDGQKLLAEKVELTDKNGSTYRKDYIYLMNTDGSIIQKIQI